jgi:hypothetical protein
MKQFILSIAFVAAVFVGKAQTAAPANSNAPEITFETEMHDFGTFKQGGNGVYEFVFKNTGKEPLIINNAQGSCGCTVPTWPKEPILPGKSSAIKVSYDTKRLGAFNKNVTLTTNAKTPTTVLTIKGVIEELPKEQTSPFKNTDNMAAPLENNKPNN